MRQLGAIIRFQRKEKGYTLKTLSEKIGISVMTLQRIETGQISPSVALMQQVARHLEKPVSYFIRDREAEFTHLTANELATYSDRGVNLTEVVPPRLIDDRLTVYLARAENEAVFQPQLQDSLAFLYQIEGGTKCSVGDEVYAITSGQGVHLDSAKETSFSSEGAGQYVLVVLRK